MSKLAEFLKGKRVALVGPAESAIGQSYGSAIEGFDVVVRVKSFDFEEKYEIDLGKRTDILFTDGVLHKRDGYANAGVKPKEHFYDDYTILERKNIKHIVCNFPADHFVYSERSKGSFDAIRSSTNIPVSNVSSDRWHSAKEVLSRPNAGCIAMIDLLGYEISELFIVGLDFFRTGYNEGNFFSFLKTDLINEWHENSDEGEYHWVDRQYLFFKYNLMVNDGRVKVDDRFNSILRDDSLDYMFELRNHSDEDRAVILQKLISHKLKP